MACSQRLACTKGSLWWKFWEKREDHTCLQGKLTIFLVRRKKCKLTLGRKRFEASGLSDPQSPCGTHRPGSPFAMLWCRLPPFLGARAHDSSTTEGFVSMWLRSCIILSALSSLLITQNPHVCCEHLRDYESLVGLIPEPDLTM